MFICVYELGCTHNEDRGLFLLVQEIPPFQVSLLLRPHIRLPQLRALLDRLGVKYVWLAHPLSIDSSSY